MGRVAEENPGRKMTYPVKLTVFCDDRAGMLKEMTAVISDDGTNIRGFDSKSTGDSAVSNLFWKPKTCATLHAW